MDLNITQVCNTVQYFEKPVKTNYSTREGGFPTDTFKISQTYVDFIIEISGLTMMTMTRNCDYDIFRDMILHALPPRFRNADLEIIELMNHPMEHATKFGIVIKGYNGNVYTPSETKRWIYCPSCGVPLKNHSCEYCGLQL